MRTKVFIILAVMFAVIATGCNNKKDGEPTNNNSKAVGTVTDICGNTYNYVRIGSRYWLAENMRCNKYDTESEQAGVKLKSQDEKFDDLNLNEDEYYLIPHDYFISAHYHYTRDYDIEYLSKYMQLTNLSPEQIQKLGLGYTWLAAVGFASKDEVLAFTIDSEGSHGVPGKRQGICPNGWHIPTSEEWRELINLYFGFGCEGVIALQSTGWISEYHGTNSSGFDALPSGCNDFWGTCDEDNGLYVFRIENTHVSWSGWSLDGEGSSSCRVRCVKN